jgi:hypothetical protein
VCNNKYHNNRKHKIPKNPKNTTPSQQNKFTNTQQEKFHSQPITQSTPNKSNCTNTQQKKFHKQPTRDLKLTNTKSKSNKTPNKKRNSTNHTQHPTTRENPQTTQHPTKREYTNYPTRDLKLEILIANIKTPKSLETRHMSFETMMMNEPSPPSQVHHQVKEEGGHKSKKPKKNQHSLVVGQKRQQ